MSRNPFISAFEAEFNKEASNPQLIDMSASVKESPKKKATFRNTAEELFVRCPSPSLHLSISPSLPPAA
jgi:hypothetical protein